MCELTIRLLKFMLVLGLEGDFFSNRHQFMFKGEDKNRTIFRSLYYSAMTKEDIEPGILRCGAHHDYGTIVLPSPFTFFSFRTIWVDWK